MGFLYAMQAAGMVTDFIGKWNQQSIAQMGTDAEKEGIDANIAQARLEYEDQSLQAMQRLRANLGTQAAVQASRGTATNAGSAVAIRQGSLNNFDADAKMRRMNMLNREGQLRAGKTMAELHQKGFEQQVWGDFTKSIFNQVPTGGVGGGAKSSSFGATQVPKYWRDANG